MKKILKKVLHFGKRYAIIIKRADASQYGSVVQLVRMPPCHGGGRGFESHPNRHFLLARVRVNQSCDHADLAHLVERHLAKVEVAGSNPVIRSNHLPL